MDLLEQMAAIAVVFLLLGAILWVLRRRGFTSAALARKPRTRRLECMERLPLGPQQMLHLVRIGQTEVLVASSPTGCQLLKSFGDGDGETSR